MSLVDQLVAASNAIYEATCRERDNFLLVTEGTPLHAAIMRGELRALGIAPERGYAVEDGVIRFDKPAVSAVDRLAQLAPPVEQG